MSPKPPMKNMTPANTLHPGLLHPAFSPSLSRRGDGRRGGEGGGDGRREGGREGRRERGVTGSSQRGSTGEREGVNSHVTGPCCSVGGKREIHKLQIQNHIAGHNCNGQTGAMSTEINYSLSEKRVKVK